MKTHLANTSGTRSRCRYSSRPSRHVKVVQLNKFMATDATSQCIECARIASRVGAAVSSTPSGLGRRPEVVTRFERNMFARDLACQIAIHDAHKREMAAARARCQNDPELCALLLEDAQRRGKREIDWPDYFRNIRIND